nr:unnamed protein product [Callosobruchus chinensis]
MSLRDKAVLRGSDSPILQVSGFLYTGTYSTRSSRISTTFGIKRNCALFLCLQRSLGYTVLRVMEKEEQRAGVHVEHNRHDKYG